MKAALSVALLLAGTPAAAVPGATMERPLCDPCVPPSVKASAVPQAPMQGAALRAQVVAKLRAPFDAAAPGGRMTRAQARAAGLGFIERHFDAIDAGRRGTIAFDDYLRFLESRGGRLP